MQTQHDEVQKTLFDKNENLSVLRQSAEEKDEEIKLQTEKASQCCC